MRQVYAKSMPLADCRAKAPARVLRVEVATARPARYEDLRREIDRPFRRSGLAIDDATEIRWITRHGGPGVEILGVVAKCPKPIRGFVAARR